MDRFEELLRDSLQAAGRDFEPADRVVARERFLATRRRRRYLVFAEGAAAVAMAVAAVFFFARADLGREPTIEVAEAAPEVVATIGTGGAPVAVAFGEGAVWMTDSQTRTVQKIDPSTNRVLQTIPLGAGTPDEVVVGLGSVWVSDTTGSVFRIDPQSGATEPYRLLSGTDVHLDLALSDDDLWAVDPATGTAYTVLAGSVEPTLKDGSSATDFHPSDVAAAGPEVWGFDPNNGLLAPLLSIETVFGDGERRFTQPIDVPQGDLHSDLALGFDAAWIATGSNGEVHRVSLETGEVTATQRFGGTYTDLSVDIDGNAVWALAIDPDQDRSELFKMDPRTGKVIAEPLQIEGTAADVSTGDGSVWIPDRAGDLLKVSPEAAEGEEQTDEEPSLGADQLMFVYVQEGDLFAQYPGRSGRLTETPEVESDPAVSADGRYVVFERISEGDIEPTLVTLDLISMEECCERFGSEPAIGPNDQIAWVVDVGGTLPSNGGISTETRVAFSTITDNGGESYPAFTNAIAIPGTSITELSWEQSGQVLFVETQYEGRDVRTADLILDSDQMVTDMKPAEVVPVVRDGVNYVAPSSAFTLNVVATCCVSVEGDLPDRLEFGQVEPYPEFDYTYTKIADLPADADALDPAGELFTVFLGNVNVGNAGDGLEVTTGNRALWLVGDGDGLWAVDQFGEIGEVLLDATDVAAPHPFFEPFED